mmetsp:Transcript_5854/g.8668  ORF Transcript_5854/g.8668 Transcript_5854/m.8668 type:complete len:220 (-) Transcript_5854:812-1471(-)
MSLRTKSPLDTKSLLLPYLRDDVGQWPTWHKKLLAVVATANPLAYAIATYSPSASPAPTAPVLPASPQAPNADGNNDEKASTPPPPLPFPTASSLQASTSDFDKANTFLYSLILTHLKDDASYILDTVPSLNGYAAKVRIHGSGSIGLLRNVKHVPALKVNLLSVSRLTSSGFLISFYPRHCILKRNDLTIRGPRIGNLYHQRMLYVCLYILSYIMYAL